VVGNLNGFKRNERVVKCSESLRNRVSNIIRRYIGHTKFAGFRGFSFIKLFHVLLVPCFKSLCICLYVLYTLV